METRMEQTQAEINVRIEKAYAGVKETIKQKITLNQRERLDSDMFVLQSLAITYKFCYDNNTLEKDFYEFKYLKS